MVHTYYERGKWAAAAAECAGGGARGRPVVASAGGGAAPPAARTQPPASAARTVTGTDLEQKVKLGYSKDIAFEKYFFYAFDLK